MKKLLIRADGNGEIGSGHIMRCSAIAAEAGSDGIEAVFAVSDDASRMLVEDQGFRSEVVGGDYRSLGVQDADALSNLAKRLCVDAILVDSYAITETFFKRLADFDIACAYVDDAYTFAGGFRSVPKCYELCAVINYSFGFSEDDYKSAYADKPTSLCIGPQFAPVRQAFRDIPYQVNSEVKRVLVTSGMTNPLNALERMAVGCRKALPEADITVIVGMMAEFDATVLPGTGFRVISNAQNMHELMAESDLAVSAAGTTLYELACVGVPVVAAPIVDNQCGNANGVEKLGIGKSLGTSGWNAYDVERAVTELSASFEKRQNCSLVSRKLVDGYGAYRMFEAVEAMSKL